MKNLFSDKKWYPMAVSICIGVLFYFLLTHLSTVWLVVGYIGYFVYPLVAGAIIAYLINPLMRLFENKIFRFIKHKKLNRVLSMIISMIIVLAFISGVFALLVPQLYESIKTLYTNKDAYIEAVSGWLNKIGAGAVMDYFSGWFSSPEKVMNKVIDYVQQNEQTIGTSITKVGGHIGVWFIGWILSIYFLLEKDRIGNFAMKMIRVFQKDAKKTDRFIFHLRKIDAILTRYLVFSFIDGLIIGTLNGIFMAVMGMRFGGLVSVIVGLTNLVPTFGPLIGGTIGGLILLMVNPIHAFYFVIFALIIQTIDAYILKPKLFGGTFGISGLWILIAIIVGSRIFGVLGIILAIPFVAISDYLINKVYIPYRRALAAQNAAEAGEQDPGVSESDIPDNADR